MSRAPASHVHLLEEVELALPLHRYAGAFPARAGTFLLDGAGAPEGKEHLAEHAMLGAEPVVTFRAHRSTGRRGDGALAARVVVRSAAEETAREVDDAIESLRELASSHAFDGWVARPMPFMGGLVGYLGYEVGQMLERLPCVARPGSGMPDIAFSLHRWVLGVRRSTGRAWLSVLGAGATAEGARRDAERTRDEVLRRLRAVELASVERASGDAPPHDDEAAGTPVPRDLQGLEALARAVGVRESLGRDDYVARVRAAKAAIERGDVYEVCLTQRLEAPFTGDPWSLFRALRRASPAPFAAMLDLPEGAIVSSSPERFVSLDARRRIESRPIKGTRPRGATGEEDERLASDLATATKDRAENAMIVDLVRNDVGRVARFGTVTVPELYAVERYATVHQLVSSVRGELDEGKDVADLVRACFPPGSMTGAPKIEAMTVLEHLEPTERGVYSGALGWLDLSGTADLGVVIRTIVVKDEVARFHVGGAVVADSVPADEHDESLHKARALVAALAEARP